MNYKAAYTLTFIIYICYCILPFQPLQAQSEPLNQQVKLELAAKYKKQFRNLIMSGKCRKARRLAKNNLKRQDPSDRQALAKSYKDIGLAYYYCKSYNQAEYQYRNALKINKKDFEVHYMLGHIYTNIAERKFKQRYPAIEIQEVLEHLDDAANSFEHAYKYKPNSQLCQQALPNIYNKIGDLNYVVDYFDGAIDNYSQAINWLLEIPEQRRKMDVGKLYISRAVCYMIRGRLTEAQQDCEQAIKRGEQIAYQAEGYNLLGMIATKNQQYQEARNHYDHALALAHDRTCLGTTGNNCRKEQQEYQRNKGITYFLENNFEQALPLFKQASKDNIGQFFHYYTQLRMGKKEEEAYAYLTRQEIPLRDKDNCIYRHIKTYLTEFDLHTLNGIAQSKSCVQNVRNEYKQQQINACKIHFNMGMYYYAKKNKSLADFFLQKSIGTRYGQPLIEVFIAKMVRRIMNESEKIVPTAEISWNETLNSQEKAIRTVSPNYETTFTIATNFSLEPENVLLVQKEKASKSGETVKYRFEEATVVSDDSHQLQFTQNIDLQTAKLTELYVKVRLPNQRTITSEPLTLLYLPSNSQKQTSNSKKIQQSNLHILSIGVMTPPYHEPGMVYQTPSVPSGKESQTTNLRYPEKDAQDIADIFTDGYNHIHTLFREVNTTPLVGEDITAFGIHRFLKNYPIRNQMTDQDVSIIYLSAHGFVHDNELRIQASDYDENLKDETSIAYRDIFALLKKIPGTKIIWLDACYSGSLTFDAPPLSNSIRMKSRRKASKVAVSQAITKLLNATDGIIALASSQEGQRSYECEPCKNGTFTQALLEAFGQDPEATTETNIQTAEQADADGNGILYLDELASYVQNRTIEIIQKQSPYFMQEPVYKNDMENLPIYILGE